MGPKVCNRQRPRAIGASDIRCVINVSMICQLSRWCARMLDELTIATGRDAEQPHEGTAHHVDIAETDRRCDLFERSIGSFELSACSFHPHLQHIL